MEIKVRANCSLRSSAEPVCLCYTTHLCYAGISYVSLVFPTEKSYPDSLSSPQSPHHIKDLAHVLMDQIIKTWALCIH